MRKVTNDLIIQTAESLLTAGETVTLAKIATELNISHVALYRHFKNKDDLWTAVSTRWFNRTVLNPITLKPTYPTNKAALKDWLWQLVNAKKATYNDNPRMFQLNTAYIDDRPLVLRQVMQPAYAKINQLMHYDPADTTKAEAIMSAFAVFLLPNFRDSWNLPDYDARFNDLWALIEAGL